MWAATAAHGGRQQSPSSQLSHPDLYVYRYLGWDDYHFDHSTVRLFLPGRGELPYMMSAKFSVLSLSRISVPFVCFLGTPLPSSTADVIYGSTITPGMTLFCYTATDGIIFIRIENNWSDMSPMTIAARVGCYNVNQFGCLDYQKMQKRKKSVEGPLLKKF